MAGKIVIGQINQGGLAQSRYEGRKNSLAEIVGVDIHSQPGVIRANFALKLAGDGAIDAAVQRFVYTTLGELYAFSSTSGKIWKYATGTWTLVYTTVADAGGSGCLGAIEFEGYIYWCTESRLHRILVTQTSNWAVNAVPNWQTLTHTDALYHPMIAMDSRCYIGDGLGLHQLYQGVFTADALKVFSYHRITSLSKYDYDILVGTESLDANKKAIIYRWNRWSSSWNIEDDVDDVNINAILPMDNGVMIQVGDEGKFYSYNGGQMELYTEVPADYDTCQLATSDPCVAVLKGMPIFAMSKVSGTTNKCGIYSLYSHNPTMYPRVMNLEYITSSGTTTDVSITGIFVASGLLFVAWNKANAFHIDVLDTATKLDGAYIATRAMYIDRDQQMTGSTVTINYVSLPAGTDVEVYCRTNYASSWGTKLDTVKDAKRCQIGANVRRMGNVLEYKFVLRCTGTSTPVIDQISISVE